MDIITLPVGHLETNCYIVSLPERNDCFVIDPGDDADSIRAAAGGKEIAAVLLTHGHYDHTGALNDLDVPVYMHPSDEIMLTDHQWSVTPRYDPFVPRKARVQYVMEGSQFSLCGVDITVLHTPGHTPGSVCYQTAEALFSGDTLFHRGYGRTDMIGGDFRQLVASLRRLYRLPGETPFYPGHGESSTIAKERGQ